MKTWLACKVCVCAPTNVYVCVHFVCECVCVCVCVCMCVSLCKLLSAWPNFAVSEEFGSERRPLLVWVRCAGCFLSSSNRKLMFKFIWGQGKGFSFHFGSFEGEKNGPRHRIAPLQSGMCFRSLYCFIVYFGWTCSFLYCEENIYFLGYSEVGVGSQVKSEFMNPLSKLNSSLQDFQPSASVWYSKETGPWW